MSKKRPLSPSARHIAWTCLQRWSKGGAFAESLVSQATQQAQLSPSDRGLVQAIVYASLRHKSWLEHLCKKLRKGALDEDLRWLLISALAQLFILKMPSYAVVDESVKMAPRAAQGLVNAILRQAGRQQEEIEAERETLPLHIQYSTPEWIVRSWVKQYGEEQTRALLEWNLQSSPIYAHVNPLRPMKDIPSEWEPLEGLSGWYCVHGSLPHEALRQGEVYITDPSTRHCIDLLNPQPGEKLLDTCAAPGGKSIAMVYATQGQLELLSCDLKEHRLAPLRENILRAGIEQVQVAVHDWTLAPPTEWEKAFDAVLIDLPCSNTGVLQRRVDARWRLSRAELERIKDLQLKIAHQAAKAVRPGGRLVYSTCSIEEEENQLNVEKFLATHPDFTLEHSYLALPHRERADGAYAALLRRQ